MAGRGPAPREGAVRPNQGGKTVFSLPSEGFKGKVPPLRGDHTAETYAWYAVWGRSPQAVTFIETDWQRLQQLAFIVDQVYRPEMADVFSREGEVTGQKRQSPPVTALLAEIRQCEKLLGATVLDRASLYMTIQPPAEPKTTAKTSPVAKRTAERQSTMHIVADTG